MKVKRISVFVLLFALMISLMSENTAAGYPDVEQGDWYYDAVYQLIGRGCYRRVSGRIVYPEKTLTVAHF
jgi:hypothetical protein